MKSLDTLPGPANILEISNGFVSDNVLPRKDGGALLVVWKHYIKDVATVKLFARVFELLSALRSIFLDTENFRWQFNSFESGDVRNNREKGSMSPRFSSKRLPVGRSPSISLPLAGC